MASEERDRKFDQALARHLRSAGPAEETAHAPAGSASPFSTCPDAETLAAFHERRLLPDELNSCKEHIVGCQKCQMILAHLEETDAIPLQALDEEKVFITAELGSVAASAGRASVRQFVVGGNAEEKTAAQVSPPEKTRRVLPLRGARWSWLVPAGAIAAGLLVWIVTHESRAPQSLSSEETKIAKNEPVATAPIPAKPTLAPPPTSSYGAVAKVQPLPSDSMSSRSESHGFEARQKQVPTAASETPSSAHSDKEGGSRKDAEREGNDVLRQTENQRDLDSKVAGGVAQDKLEQKAQTPAPSGAASSLQVQAQEQAANANIQNQNQINANMQKIPGPAPLGQATEAKKMKPARPAPAPPAPAAGNAGSATRGYQSSATLALAKAIDGRLIAAPGYAAVWRTGPAGLIEFSSDKGVSWSRQPSGVMVDLLAGSAVSDKICWIAGRAGTVLLTIDGGAHWNSLALPTNEDLGAIRAGDALHAKVWNVERNKAYETKDGGVTWQSANP